MPTTQPRVLAIDLGTSACKAAVIAPGGEVLAVGRAAVETLRLSGDGAEQDPEQVWQAVRAACRTAIAGSGAAAGIVGIGICSQYSSIIPVDEEGLPTMNMILWQDKRGAPEALARQGAGRGLHDGWLRKLQWLRIHGIPPLDSGIDSLAHMRFVKVVRPDVYARTHAFLEPADYLALRLTGRMASNPCSAFLTLLVDNRRLQRPRYHPSLVAYSGIDPAKLPELLSVDAQIGPVLAHVAADLGLPAGVRVWAPVNDTQAAGMGSGAFRGDHAGISIGTTSVMVTHVDAQRTDIRNSIVSMPSPIPGIFLVMAENGIGGRALEYFLERLVFSADGFADHDLEEKFAALHRAVAEVEPGSGGVLFLPWLTGSMSPAEDGRVRGGFLNISLETGRPHLGRAVLEGVAMNFRWLKGPTEGFARRSFSHLYFYGGGARSDLWAQIIADVLQLPVHQAADPEFVACRGLGFLVLHRHGLLTLDAIANRVPTAAVRAPRRELAARYDLMFQQFVRAFRVNRSIFRALHPLQGRQAQEPRDD